MMESRKLTFGEKLRSVGEEPVVLDQSNIGKSARQLSIYLINKGFFDNSVTDSVFLNKDKRLADVYYMVKTGKPYTYRNIEFVVKDSVLLEFIDSLKNESFIKSGNNFSGN
jgi:outer membrane protein assembly factor BamA